MNRSPLTFDGHGKCFCWCRSLSNPFLVHTQSQENVFSCFGRYTDIETYFSCFVPYTDTENIFDSLPSIHTAACFCAVWVHARTHFLFHCAYTVSWGSIGPCWSGAQVHIDGSWSIHRHVNICFAVLAHTAPYTHMKKVSAVVVDTRTWTFFLTVMVYRRVWKCFLTLILQQTFFGLCTDMEKCFRLFRWMHWHWQTFLECFSHILTWKILSAVYYANTQGILFVLSGFMRGLILTLLCLWPFLGINKATLASGPIAFHLGGQ